MPSILSFYTVYRILAMHDFGIGQGVGENVFGVKLLGAKTKRAPSEHFILAWLPQPGREAKENIIFFVAQSPTLLRSGLAEGP